MLPLSVCLSVSLSADGDLPKHRPNPMIRVHKLENIQTCLDFLKKEGVQVSRIHADGKYLTAHVLSVLPLPTVHHIVVM